MEIEQFICQQLAVKPPSHATMSCLEKFKVVMSTQYSKETLKIEEIASQLAMSERNLRRKCSDLFGLSPTALLLNCRVEVAKRLLQQGLLVTEVYGQVGFSNHSHFSTQFKRITGLTPSQYKQSRDLWQ